MEPSFEMSGGEIQRTTIPPSEGDDRFYSDNDPHKPANLRMTVDPAEDGGPKFSFIFNGRTDKAYRDVINKYSRLTSDRSLTYQERQKHLVEMFREVSKLQPTTPVLPTAAPKEETEPAETTEEPAVSSTAKTGVRVEFLFTSRGDSEIKVYEEAFIHDNCLVLVSADGGYVPPSTDREPALEVNLPGLALPVPVINAKLTFPHSGKWYLVLAVDRSRE